MRGIDQAKIWFCDISVTARPIRAKFWNQDPIFAMIIIKEMMQIDYSVNHVRTRMSGRSFPSGKVGSCSHHFIVHVEIGSFAL